MVSAASLCAVGTHAFALPSPMLLSSAHHMPDVLRTRELFLSSAVEEEQKADDVVMVSEQQQKAIRDFKMITEDEATLRKAAGVGIGLATAGIYATSGMAYGSLSAGIFGAISTYRTGAEYQ